MQNVKPTAQYVKSGTGAFELREPDSVAQLAGEQKVNEKKVELEGPKSVALFFKHKPRIKRNMIAAEFTKNPPAPH